MRGNERRQWMQWGGLVWLGLALLLSACSVPLELPIERCLQVLEYLEPGHGDIEASESHARGSGTTVVAIHYLGEDASGASYSQAIACEYEAGERWNFDRIWLRERELSEMELTLVNSEFLLRDLDRHPERLSDRPAAGATPARLEVGSGPAHADIPAGLLVPEPEKLSLTDRHP
jgi:hypothetical protein